MTEEIPAVNAEITAKSTPVPTLPSPSPESRNTSNSNSNSKTTRSTPLSLNLPNESSPPLSPASVLTSPLGFYRPETPKTPAPLNIDSSPSPRNININSNSQNSTPSSTHSTRSSSSGDCKEKESSDKETPLLNKPILALIPQLKQSFHIQPPLTHSSPALESKTLSPPRTRSHEKSSIEPWWYSQHPKLWSVDKDGSLMMGGKRLEKLANEYGTPLYVYSASLITERVTLLKESLNSIGQPHQIYFAMKSNRYLPVLQLMKKLGVGLDCCSPNEIDLGLKVGFKIDDMSFTAGNLSNKDLDALVKHKIHVNLDSFSGIRRYADRAPSGTAIGLRINPSIGIGYDHTLYYGKESSKLGLHLHDFDRALTYAEKDRNLIVDTLHVHCGWGLQSNNAKMFDEVMAEVAGLAKTMKYLKTINVGGGLGVRHKATDEALSLSAWANSIKTHLAPLGVRIVCEPGTLLVHDAGILLVEVNTVEDKNGTKWIGVNAGFNTNLYAAHYGLRLEPIVVPRPLARPSTHYNIGGNINEAIDVFNKKEPMPQVFEGDLIGFYPAGGYGATMSSFHCMREGASELLID